ncbi:flavin-containing monooxygenase FMO GS-OX-like 4 [Venturia canescens]|uniref:flavin-containing monooxygenase FMO GS-OX-like 4 n=1 Tax=Venturia canescens TaxID=32260 RepID=UPI001C9CEEA7|nr:flavin-containing monooxygenase FMO GS-OX-like 4 [Venturia canescens]
MGDSDKSTRIRVCVIGAGAAGLCAARHLASETRNFEPAVFEQQNDVGGTWIYEEKIGLDDHGYPIHSSMYANLRTNLPLKLMSFPDYLTLGQSTDAACGTHQDVLHYLHDYADHFQLRQYIQFNTRVECVRPVINADHWKKTSWKVRVRNIKTQVLEEKDFDAVVICNGHFFEPDIPLIPGIETFPGSVMHSHEYRKPDQFEGKRVIVLGASSSGIDIGIEVAGKASHVYLSHNHERLNGSLPYNMTQVAGVEKISNKQFTLRDGTNVEVDSFIYCTGYKYTFPFLDESCSIKIDENYVSPLYKHLVNVEHPSMCIVGIPTTVIPFALFHMQIKYYLRVLRGKVSLPTKAEMLEDSKLKSTNKRHAHTLGNQQFDYNDDLAISGSFERLPAYYKNGYLAWHEARAGNLLNYKDSKFVILPDNVNVQITPATLPA